MIIRYARDIQTYSYLKKIKRHILQQFKPNLLKIFPRFKFFETQVFSINDRIFSFKLFR